MTNFFTQFFGFSFSVKVLISSLDNRDLSVSIPNYCVAGENIYQIGGRTAMNPAKADCFILSKTTQKWQRRCSIFRERCYSTVCGAPDGKVYDVGGHTLQPRDRQRRVEMFAPAENVWKKMPKMIYGRYKAGCVCTSDGNLIGTGGVNNDVTLAECEYLPKNSENWMMMPALQQPRSGHQLVEFNGYLYAIGGRGADSHEVATVERIPLEFKGSWKTVTSMTVKR